MFKHNKMSFTKIPKKASDLLKKPLKRVGKLYGVTFVTIKPINQLSQRKV